MLTNEEKVCMRMAIFTTREMTLTGFEHTFDGNTVFLNERKSAKYIPSIHSHLYLFYVLKPCTRMLRLRCLINNQMTFTHDRKNLPLIYRFLQTLPLLENKIHHFFISCSVEYREYTGVTFIFSRDRKRPWHSLTLNWYSFYFFFTEFISIVWSL